MVRIICKFLSGGGAANFDCVSERFVLLGIVSGSAEEECGTKYFPNVYSRLNSVSLLEWIYEKAPDSNIPDMRHKGTKLKSGASINSWRTKIIIIVV